MAVRNAGHVLQVLPRLHLPWIHKLRPPSCCCCCCTVCKHSWRRPAQSSELVTAEDRTRRVRQSHRPMLHRQRARAFTWQVQLSVCLCESSSYLPLSHIVAQLIVVHCLKALGVTHTSLPSRMHLSSTVSILRFLCLTAQYKKQQIFDTDLLQHNTIYANSV